MPTTDVQRLRSRCSARGAGLIMAACPALACGDAQAQSAPPYPDPFAPQLETNPRNPPRFQKQAPGTPARSEQLRTFTPVPSGAGMTGFDATMPARNFRRPSRSLARRWLIGTVKLGYGTDDYVGLDRDDNRFSAGIGLTYKLNLSLQIKGEIDHNWLRSNVTSNNYDETLFLLGIRLQR